MEEFNPFEQNSCPQHKWDPFNWAQAAGGEWKGMKKQQRGLDPKHSLWLDRDCKQLYQTWVKSKERSKIRLLSH